MDTSEPKPEIEEQTGDHNQAPQTIEQASPIQESQVVPEKQTLKQKLAAIRAAYITHKKLSIPLTIVVLLAILTAVPVTRYPLLGLAIKKNFSATIVDAKTNKPVSSVELKLGNKTAKTDQNGNVIFTDVPVGNYTLTATKKYYKDNSSSVLVSLKGGSTTLQLDATGRQVAVKVTNMIDGSTIQDARVSAAGTEVKTDQKGEAVIVLPVGQDTQDATITKDGFNMQTAKIKVVESEAINPENTLSITPSGKVYFLSKRTGKINVMKSNLDGTNSEVVLNATGSEDDGDTILLASQDWKYLALKSKRNGANKPASLYLIDTANGDKLTTMDEGEANFTLTGWSGHTFVYQVHRNKVESWKPNRQSIKSFNADTNKLTALDNTAGEGTGAADYYGTDYRLEYLANVILVGDTVSYTKVWQSGVYAYNNSKLAGKQNGIYTVKVDDQNKKTIKTFDATTNTSIDAKLYKPKEVYYQLYISGKSEFYELENGSLSPKGDLSGQFYSFYPTYLYSPSNEQTFWAEPRDGKNTLFIGDNEGDDSKTVAELSEYAAYGWFTNNYLLLSKNSSELYIIGSEGMKAGQKALKITDYHKPNTTFYGYGGGYGGL